MPQVDRDTIIPYERCAYPGKLAERTKGCWKSKLGDQVGLTQLGVGEVELAPGSATGSRATCTRKASQGTRVLGSEA